MAYFFFKLEKEEMARLSLMAALSLDEKDSPLLINPFLDAIMDRSLAFHMQAAQDTQEPKGLIEDSPSNIIIP